MAAPSEKLNFKGAGGEDLAARLDRPAGAPELREAGGDGRRPSGAQVATTSSVGGSR